MPSSVAPSRTSTPASSSNLNPNNNNNNGVAPKQTKICVYCGASSGKDPIHLQAARDLARAMAANNIALGKIHMTKPPHSFLKTPPLY